MTSHPPLGVYVHWPYCARICPYCDFNVFKAKGREAEAADLAQAIVADLEAQRGITGPRELVSVFFGVYLWVVDIALASAVQWLIAQVGAA